MTVQEIDIFKKEFKSIVYHKGVITNHNSYIRTLHAYDKNGSHNNAILKALDKRKELQTQFLIMLKGKTYDEWKEMSKLASSMNSRLKKSVNRKEFIQSEIDKIKFI